jgi:hypothetical protein
MSRYTIDIPASSPGEQKLRDTLAWVRDQAAAHDVKPREQDLDRDDGAEFDVPVRDDEGPDFTFRNEGSLVILVAHSHEAQLWAIEHLPADATTWGRNGTVIEWRYFPAILEGIQNDGLTIKEQG